MAKQNEYSRHKVMIGGVTYSNVGSIEEKKEPVYFYNVTTLDGVRHQKIRYYQTTYIVTFYNLNDGSYETLRNAVLSTSRGTLFNNCQFPVGADTGDYYVTIESPDKWKGYMKDPDNPTRRIYFKNGLKLKCEKREKG